MSTCMYKIRPLLKHDEPIPKPTHNMYSIRPTHGFVVQESSHTVRLSDVSGHVQEILKGSQGDLASLEKRQEDILRRLAQLKLDMKNLRTELNSTPQATASHFTVRSLPSACSGAIEAHDIVVYASPQYLPYSLLALTKLWKLTFPIEMHNHTHSSVKEAPAAAAAFVNTVSNKPRLSITLIWKDVGSETELVTNPVKHSAIRGETNILRYLSRVGPLSTAYENDNDLVRITELDKFLDICQRLARCTAVKEKQSIIRSLNACLGKSQWMCGRSQLSIVDLAAWSVLKQSGSSADLTQNLTKWMERCDSLLLL